jgi:hypothetical protein
LISDIFEGKVRELQQSPEAAEDALPVPPSSVPAVTRDRPSVAVGAPDDRYSEPPVGPCCVPIDDESDLPVKIEDIVSSSCWVWRVRCLLMDGKKMV